MECTTDVLAIVLYSLGSILLTVLIIVAIKLVKTVNKTNKLLDNVNKKAEQLNSAFDIAEKTSGVVDTVSDKIIAFIMNSIKKLVKNKERDEEDE